MDLQHLEMMEKYVDVLQIGARNMQNFKLLEAVGESPLPVLLKRGYECNFRRATACFRIYSC